MLDACPDLPGADALLAPSMPRIVWVGEMHGTNEMPALFGDLVCAAGQTGRKIVVLLEREDSEQANWDAFLESGDKARLTSGTLWHWETQDGRNSQAMVGLAERLRQYKVTVRLMQRDLKSAANIRLANETAMADSVKEAARAYPDAVILAYSGGLHAQKTLSPIDKDMPLAASLLPAGEITSVHIEGAAGTAWTCLSDGCGVHSFGGVEAHSRGVVLENSEQGFDAVAYTGLPNSASPPAVTPAGK